MMIIDSGLLLLGHPVCVQPTVDYIDFTRTVGVGGPFLSPFWCRRFELLPFWSQTLTPTPNYEMN